jgi:hypothetical protein
VRTAAPALVRALYKFGDRFSADQLERIKRAVTGEVFTYRMRGHGTENHAMDFVSALYLLPQYFPDATWSVARLVGWREFPPGPGILPCRPPGTAFDHLRLSARSSVNLWEFARWLCDAERP